MKKRGIEFSFTWLFVLIVGATILMLAVFMASRLISRESNTYNSEVAAGLGAVLIPIETSIETSKYYPLAFPAETRLFNDCVPEGTFGRQELSVSVRSGIGEAWSEEGIPYRTSGAFIFSEENFEGKQAHVISTAIKLPYKIGNALVLYTKTYCFVNPPESIEDDILALGADNMEVVEQVRDCTSESVRVCFSGTGCDVIVNADTTSEGSVRREGRERIFVEGLFYAALVSEKEIYDCQLVRMRKRASELAKLYIQKSTFLDSQGCTNSLEGALFAYQTKLLSSTPLEVIITDAEELARNNERLACRLF